MSLIKKIDPGSHDSYVSSLDLFSLPYTQTGAYEANEREFLPMNDFKDPPYQFRVAVGGSYVDMPKTRIVTQWKMSVSYKPDPIKKTKKVKNDKGVDVDVEETFQPPDALRKLTATDRISVCNGFGSRFIRNLRVTVNGVTTSNANNHYPFIAMFNEELYTTKAQKESTMQSQGYYYEPRDSKYKFYERPSFVALRDLFVDGKYAEFSTPIYADNFQQSRYWLSNTELELTIHPAKAEFVIMAESGDPPIKLELMGIKLYMTFVDVLPGTANDIEEKLQTTPAMYPMQRATCSSLFYEKQRMEANNTIFSGQIPRFIAYAFISKDAYNGKYDVDPFECLPYGIADTRLNASGHVTPFAAWDLDFARGKYIRAFEHLQRTIGFETGITRKMFAEGGYCIFPFNLTSTMDDDDGFNFIRDGPTMLFNRFHEPMPEGGVYCLVYGRFDSILYIDAARNLRTDNSV